MVLHTFISITWQAIVDIFKISLHRSDAIAITRGVSMAYISFLGNVYVLLTNLDWLEFIEAVGIMLFLT